MPVTLPHPQPQPRIFPAEHVLSGQVDPRVYPVAFICVVGALTSAYDQRTTGLVMAAAELLESQGWQVVSFVENGTQHSLKAYLRRTHRPLPPRPVRAPGEPPPPPPDPVVR